MALGLLDLEGEEAIEDVGLTKCSILCVCDREKGEILVVARLIQRVVLNEKTTVSS